MKDLVIIGASGFGREVAWLVERINTVQPTWNVVGFIDDNENIHGKEIAGYKVIGPLSKVMDFPNAHFVCAIGASKIRNSIVNKLKTMLTNIKFATLIDPSVIYSKRVTFGEGCIVCAGTIITVDITVGEHVLINLDTTIGHDSIINDFVTVYPSVNISGNTLIDKNVELGTGTQIIQGKTIGKGTIVGAGSVVVKDIPPNCTAVGSPAKPIKFHEVN